MGIDIGFQNNARYWKLVHKKVTKRWYQRYLNGLAVMFFLPRFFLAWYFKCPELTQPLSHDSSKNQTAYQKDIVEQNLAQVFIWTGIHCFVSSVNWFRLCKTKYVTDVSGTDKIFAHYRYATHCTVRLLQCDVWWYCISLHNIPLLNVVGFCISARVVSIANF